MLHCVGKMVFEEGPRSLFYGVVPGMLRFCFFVGVGNGLYVPMRNAIMGQPVAGHSTNTHDKANALQKLLAGLICGTIGTMVGHPCEVVKVRLQTQALLPKEQQIYHGTLDCFRKVLA